MECKADFAKVYIYKIKELFKIELDEHTEQNHLTLNCMQSCG